LKKIVVGDSRSRIRAGDLGILLGLDKRPHVVLGGSEIVNQTERELGESF